MTDMEEYVKKIMPDIKRAHNSVTMAEHKLHRAEADIDAGSYEEAVLAAYTSMFHSARALLFKDGYKERNHYGLCIYIREKFSQKIEMKYINELNALRTIRHKIIYGDENVNIREVQEAEAESSVKLAKGFLGTVKKIIERS